VIEPIMGVKPSRTIDRRAEQGELVDHFHEQECRSSTNPTASTSPRFEFTKSAVGDVLYPGRADGSHLRRDRAVGPRAGFEPAKADEDFFRSDALGIAGGSRNDKGGGAGLDHLLVYRPRYYDR
jgi:hypothetical protein